MRVLITLWCILLATTLSSSFLMGVDGFTVGISSGVSSARGREQSMSLQAAAKKAAPKAKEPHTIRKAEFLERMMTKTDWSKSQCELALGSVLGTIEEALVDGDKISFVGFGTFKVTDRAARTGRNPKTGEPLEIAASRSPSFSAGKPFKDKMNASKK